MASLGLVTVTKNGGERIKRLVKWAPPFFDEINIYVDGDSTDDTFEFLKDQGFNPTYIDVRGYIENVLNDVEKLKTDWVLRLDDDELMGENFENYSRELMESGVDVFLLPRYNLCSQGKYMSGALQYPDFQTRFFRSGHVTHNGFVHEGPLQSGLSSTSDMHIFHFSMLDYTREEREAKWENYVQRGNTKQIAKSMGLPEDYYRRFSIWEDYPYSVGDCEESCSIWSKEGIR